MRTTLIALIVLLSPLTAFAGLGNGLVGYWSFDSRDFSNSTIVVDRSGNGNTGTLVNSPTKTSGKVGQALSFNGTNQYVDLGTPASLNLGSTNRFTLSAWVYPTSAPQGTGVITEMYNPTNTSVMYEIGYGIDEPGGGSTLLKCGFYSQSYGWKLAIGASPTLNVWQHISCTWDGTTLILYLNGTAVYAATPGVALPTTNYDDVSIGRRHDTAGSVNYFPGKIDDVRIYNRALSLQEIKDLYRQGVSAPTSSWLTSIIIKILSLF